MFLSRMDPNTASTSQIPPSDIFVPTILESGDQPTTPIIDNTPTKKFMINF